jgi:site-specific DNA-cytosine methylase
VLGITTNKFDKALLEFEYRDGVYESTQRVYSDQGKSPTLTASNKEQMIETKPKKAYDIPREILKDNERQRRVYDPSGKSPTILGRSDSPKVTTPKQVGVAVDIKGHDQIKRVYSPEGKSPTVTTCGGGHREPKVVTGGAFRGRAYDKDGKRMDKNGVSVANKTKQMLELRNDNKSNAITTVGKDSVVAHEDLTWRKLSPLECMRLQTVPDDYLMPVSNSQKYKLLGNGWTIEVIKHIYKNMDL